MIVVYYFGCDDRKESLPRTDEENLIFEMCD